MVNFHKITILEDLINLLYPKLCAGCDNPLLKGEDQICLHCFYNLHRTNLHNERNNSIEQLFWGRVLVKYATVFCFYHKESKFQQMIFKLKYHGAKEVGYVLGKEMGLELKNSIFNEIDTIVPIPLHPKREKKRGYNQADWIARGLGEGLAKAVDFTSVKRVVETKTQTQKNKFERWKNVENIFEVAQPSKLSGKHVLVIDDVITTGATLEACIQAILDIGDTTVSVAALGFAKR